MGLFDKMNSFKAAASGETDDAQLPHELRPQHPMPVPKRDELYERGFRGPGTDPRTVIKEANVAKEMDNVTSPESLKEMEADLGNHKPQSQLVNPRHVPRIAQGFYATLANGIIDAKCTTPVPEGYIWRVERIFVLCTSVNATVFTLYRSNPTLDRTLDYTPLGNKDIADEISLPILYQGEYLLGEWTGASQYDSSGTPVVATMVVQILEEKQELQDRR